MRARDEVPYTDLVNFGYWYDRLDISAATRAMLANYKLELNADLPPNTRFLSETFSASAGSDNQALITRLKELHREYKGPPQRAFKVAFSCQTAGKHWQGIGISIAADGTLSLTGMDPAEREAVMPDKLYAAIQQAFGKNRADIVDDPYEAQLYQAANDRVSCGPVTAANIAHYLMGASADDVHTIFPETELGVMPYGSPRLRQSQIELCEKYQAPTALNKHESLLFKQFSALRQPRSFDDSTPYNPQTYELQKGKLRQAQTNAKDQTEAIGCTNLFHSQYLDFLHGVSDRDPTTDPEHQAYVNSLDRDALARWKNAIRGLATAQQQIATSHPYPEAPYHGIGVYGHATNKGFYISEVGRNCPAEKLKLQPGDIVTHVIQGGVEVPLEGKTLQAMLTLVRGKQDVAVQLKITRGGHEMVLGRDEEIKPALIDVKTLANFSHVHNLAVTEAGKGQAMMDYMQKQHQTVVPFDATQQQAWRDRVAAAPPRGRAV
jgi:hypothetical protein